ncbi:MAG TPA: hypothetical protein VLQ66_11320 [Paenisporosarcina sp.]|nr:hypothetical protein [Paenisporosarcina sp.]
MGLLVSDCSVGKHERQVGKKRSQVGKREGQVGKITVQVGIGIFLVSGRSMRLIEKR